MDLEILCQMKGFFTCEIGKLFFSKQEDAG
jgi:hypothetical protein